jgi:hypothetical protein
MEFVSAGVLMVVRALLQQISNGTNVVCSIVLEGIGVFIM